MMTVDLRSDTVTKPTAEMLEVMTQAVVGDDVFGEDPQTNAFEKKVAAHFGFEAAVFVPSGTMSNQIALALHVGAGEEIIVDHLGHIFNYESGATSVFSRGQMYPVHGEMGKINPEIISKAIRSRFNWDPLSTLVSLEQSTNKGGGAVYSAAELAAIRQLANEKNLKVHIDGARIWNALHASDTQAHRYVDYCDTLSVCFSKGLGAPVGSALLGSSELITKARRFRKMMGGGMRQIGLLTAAAEYAMDNHFPLLADDHKRALKFGTAISKCSEFELDLNSVQTNIVIFKTLKHPSSHYVKQFADEGIMTTSFGEYAVRATFHHQIDDTQLAYTLDFIQKTFNS